MKWQIALVSLLLSSQVFSADSFDKELSCYKALIGKSAGSSYALDNGAVLVPGKNNGSSGFFVYTESLRYFCYLPKKAESSNSVAKFYDLKLKIPGKAQYDMAYREDKSDPTHPSIGGLVDNTNAVEPKCVTNKSEETDTVLNSEIVKKIKTVHASFKEHGPLDKFQKFPDGYIDSLNTCISVSGEVKSAALKEISLFSLLKPNHNSESSGSGSKGR